MDRNTALHIAGQLHDKSLSARRAWIEIICFPGWYIAAASLSARRAWIEIEFAYKLGQLYRVALRKESVDRNSLSGLLHGVRQVALRKESVDRNKQL